MEPSNKQRSREFSDATIRHFLLARLNREEQSAFEESLFTDETLEQRVRLAECELTDDYAFDRLSSSERELFEQNFLMSSARKDQLRVSTSLRDRFAPITAGITLTSKNALTGQLRFIFNFRRPFGRIAFAAMLFLLIVGMVWLAIKKGPQIKEEITNRGAGRRPSPQPSPFEANHATNTSTPQHEVVPSPMREHDQTVRSVVAVSLSPAAHRESGSIRAIALPQRDDAVVRFNLALKTIESTGYRVEVQSADGKSVFAVITTAPPSIEAFNLDVPASRLKRGEYQIQLLSNRSSATVATYYFRVQ